MFGSQALETAIGLALLFFVLATAASAAVELLSKRLKKRHGDLEQAIGAMLVGGEVPWTGADSLDEAFRGSTIYRSAAVAAGKAGVTYMSAKSFADAALEVARTSEQVPAGLAARLEQVYTDVGNDITRLKAGLESWFDETMAVVESQYKKWATTWLFFVGFGLAILVNASAINVASDMWHDSATRQAVVAAAESTTASGQGATKIEDVARTTDTLKELALPVGWSEPVFDASHDLGWWVSHVIGWVLTGALLMLGAPFWFDLLSRLVSLRNSGKAPATAPNDGASATSAVLRGLAGPEPDLGGPGGGSAPAEHTRDLDAPGAERAPAGRDAVEPARGLSAALVGLIGTRPPAGGLAKLPARPQAGNATRRLAGR